MHLVLHLRAKETSPDSGLASNRSPSPLGQPMSGRFIQAFSSVDLTMLLILIGAFFVFVYPVIHSRPRVKGTPFNCISNLKQVGLAMRIYSNDHDEKFPWFVSTNQGGSMEWLPSNKAAPHFLALSNEISYPKILHCPTDTTKTRAAAFDRTFSDANISYFLGMFADETKPQTLLSGDRNLTLDKKQLYGTAVVEPDSNMGWTKAMHEGVGNLLFSDGSTSQATESVLATSLAKHTNIPIRLLFP